MGEAGKGSNLVVGLEFIGKRNYSFRKHHHCMHTKVKGEFYVMAKKGNVNCFYCLPERR